ncbi:MAG: Gx transporter family protein [Lachnospiraceae bacterium]
MKNRTQNIAVFGMLVALAFIFSYLEHLIPFPLPGVKIGIANIVVMIALYLLGGKEAFAISMVRIILVGFTFGSMYSMLYSLVGGILSLSVMVLMKRSGKFGIPGVSVVGGILHNLGQIITAVFTMEGNTNLFSLIPVYAVAGTIAGIVVGILATLIIKRLKAYLKR